MQTQISAVCSQGSHCLKQTVAKHAVLLGMPRISALTWLAGEDDPECRVRLVACSLLYPQITNSIECRLEVGGHQIVVSATQLVGCASMAYLEGIIPAGVVENDSVKRWDPRDGINELFYSDCATAGRERCELVFVVNGTRVDGEKMGIFQVERHTMASEEKHE
jgi:hypothetical protein